jgi:hypothetical protein
MLTHFRYTIAPSIVDEMKAVKNETEIEGLRRAYTRDGVAFVSTMRDEFCFRLVHLGFLGSFPRMDRIQIIPGL